MMIRVKYISLVNILLDKALVPELIQNDFNEKNLKSKVEQLINDQQLRQVMKTGYFEIKEKLGNESPSQNVAREIVLRLRGA
jgi:lipid-A-disaccharide synthase